jgi:hypothetical protein
MGNFSVQDSCTWLEPGDVVLIRGLSFVSRLIRWASQSWGEAKTLVNHVGVISKGGSLRIAEISEARWRYLVHNLWDAYANTTQEVAIYRPKNISMGTRLDIAARAASFQNTRYGWAKIALHAADKVLGGAYFFRRLAFLPNRPICSYAAAVAYADYGLSFGVNPYAAQPDDIWDYVVSSDNYSCIRPLFPIEEMPCRIP